MKPFQLEVRAFNMLCNHQLCLVPEYSSFLEDTLLVRWACPTAMLLEATKEERELAECNVSELGIRWLYRGTDKDEVRMYNGASLPHKKKAIKPPAATWTDLENHTE